MTRLVLPDWVKNPVWLDDDNAITYVTWKEETEPYMAIWYHRNRKVPEAVCFGSFGWRNPAPGLLADGPLWTRVSQEPLEFHPSLLCLDCGAHGFIQKGGWVAVP